MKRGKKHPVSFLNLVLVAIVVFELMIFANGSSVGNAVKSIAPNVLDSSVKSPVRTPVCTPTLEICDGKDNDCDKLVDEEGVCDVEEITKSNSDSIYFDRINDDDNKLEGGSFSLSSLSTEEKNLLVSEINSKTSYKINSPEELRSVPTFVLIDSYNSIKGKPCFFV